MKPQETRNKGPRICAVCLEDIPRQEYDDHLNAVHGYSTLVIEPDSQLVKCIQELARHIYTIDGNDCDVDSVCSWVSRELWQELQVLING